MKRTLLILLLTITTIGVVRAQNVDIRLGYGAYTQMDATDMHAGWDGVQTSWGTINVGVYFEAAKNLWLGTSYNYSSTNAGEKPNKYGDVKYHVVMLNAKYTYYQTPLFSLYGHAGLGCEFSKLKYFGEFNLNKTYCAFQLSPVGAECSLDNFGFFGELGFGAQGVIQVGIRILL